MIDSLDVLGDWSVRASPLKWARQVVRAYHEIKADYIVIERNAGGKALLKMNLDQVDPGLPIRDVWAKEAKEMRASNPALKYELRAGLPCPPHAGPGGPALHLDTRRGAVS